MAKKNKTLEELAIKIPFHTETDENISPETKEFLDFMTFGANLFLKGGQSINPKEVFTEDVNYMMAKTQRLSMKEILELYKNHLTESEVESILKLKFNEKGRPIELTEEDEKAADVLKRLNNGKDI